MANQYTTGNQKAVPPIARLMPRISLEPCEALGTDCWIPNYSRNTAGYAQMILPGHKMARCHRVTYEHFVGPVPDGLVLDHLCRNRACCNPRHLEAVTNRENLLRGENPKFVVARTDVCVSGRHSMADALVDVRGRRCRHCRNETKRRRAAELRALYGPLPDERLVWHRHHDTEGDGE